MSAIENLYKRLFAEFKSVYPSAVWIKPYRVYLTAGDYERFETYTKQNPLLDEFTWPRPENVDVIKLE